MNVCTRFHGSPFNSCQDISLKNRPHGGSRVKVRVSQKLLGHLWLGWSCFLNVKCEAS